MNQFPLEKQLFVNDQVLRIMRFSECLTWFILHDKIINKLVEKYFNENDINEDESKILFDRFNMSNRILINQELVFDGELVNQMLNLCPNEKWRKNVKLDFDHYDPSVASKCNLDGLDRLRLFSFHGLKLSRGLERFRGDIYSERVRALLGNIYDEINENNGLI